MTPKPGIPLTQAGRALLERLGVLPKLMPYDAEAVEEGERP